jgi:hypothetical protein
LDSSIKEQKSTKKDEGIKDKKSNHTARDLARSPSGLIVNISAQEDRSPKPKSRNATGS